MATQAELKTAHEALIAAIKTYGNKSAEANAAGATLFRLHRPKG